MPFYLHTLFKSALFRAYRVCSSNALTNEEIEYFINNFEDNGFSNRRKLCDITNNYTYTLYSPIIRV